MLCDVTLLNWPFPSDNSEVPQFTNNNALLTYVASKRVTKNGTPIVFNDVAFDGRERTALRVQMDVNNIEDLVGGSGNLNYLMMATRTGDAYNNGAAFYFIDSYDIINIDDTGASSVAMVSLNIRTDPWMNSGLATKNTMPTVRPCIVEQGHVDRWAADSSAPNIYPIKEGCDGWRELVTSHNIKTFNEQKGGARFEIFVISWLENNADDEALPVQHVGVFIPGEPVKVGMSKYTMPDRQDVIDGNLAYRMGITADSVLFVGPAPYLPVKVGGDTSTGYTLSYLTDVVGDTEAYWGNDGTKLGTPSSDVYGLDISGQNYPHWWSQMSDTMLQLPTKPTWTTGGIAYSEDGEPALYMAPYREDILCDGQGMPQFSLPDRIRFSGNTALYVEPAIDPGGYSTAFELGRLYVSSPLPLVIHEHNQGMLGTRTVVDAPNGNIIASKWLDYSLSQRAIDLQYKKQTAFVEGIGGMASSVSTGMITGNAAGILGGIASGLIGAGVTQEKYRLDRNYNDATIRNTPNQMAIVSDGGALIKNDAYMLNIANVKLDDVSMQEAANRFMLNGYNLNMLMTPDWMSRRYFNFIKTRGINLNQAIPERKYRDQVEAIFDRGVTVWHINRMATDSLTYESFDYSRENIEEALVS